MGTAEVYIPNPGPEACFPETGRCIRGAFLQYWQAHGGLAINGYPLSDEFIEVLEDGKAYQVQYFERVRMEYHPENPVPWDIELGQFGRRILQERTGQTAAPPAQPEAGDAFFQVTGHNVAPDFFQYWQANGGLAQFGYPLTEEFQEQLEDGKPYTVQYFERARFERHPENQPPYDIELGQFGRRILGETALLTESVTADAIRYTPYGILYTTDERLRGLLGPPQGPAIKRQGAILDFEHGRMIYLGDPARGDGGAVVLCGDPPDGQAFTTSRNGFVLPDINDNQPAGGGPGPLPGLYEPAGGFGRIWRQAGGNLGGRGTPFVRVRDCLGYATASDATTYIVVVQQFGPGMLLSLPGDQAADALYFTGAPPGPVAPRYEWIALPAR
jgi:hypothetical protein